MDDETLAMYVAACMVIQRVQNELERTGERRAAFSIAAAMAHLSLASYAVGKYDEWERAIYGG